MHEGEPKDLEDLLSRLEAAAAKEPKLSVGDLVDTVGKRSFGPFLLLCGLLGMSPVAGIPTAPSLIALMILLVAAQLAFGRRTIWLPRWLQRMSVKSQRVAKGARLMRKPAKVADRVAKPRLRALTGPFADRIVAVVCMAIALATPPLELLPFVAFVPALAVAVFGLGLIARDGLLVLLALAISVTALGLLGRQLLA